MTYLDRHVVRLRRDGTGPIDQLVACAARFLVASEAGQNLLGLPFDATAFSTATSVADPVSVAEDATDVWAVSQGPRQILRIPLSGGAMFTAATSEGQPNGMTITKDAVYGVTDSGTIHRLAK